MIPTIFRDNDRVVILDQSLLPGETRHVALSRPEEVAEAIRKLQVRGAPLIGVAAAMGMALGVEGYQGEVDGLPEYIEWLYQLFRSTRPTAVNLFWALERMLGVYRAHSAEGIGAIRAAMWLAAEEMAAADCEMNHRIGENGKELFGPGSRVLTICNAGALATCGHGTALGVIRSAFQEGHIEMVYACETRPVLQGARLTVWELCEDRIPVTLITDGMAGYVMQLSRVDAVIAGADRIAANGDTANKIGTYTLAVLAAAHGIPFYIAAPTSTIDPGLANGSLIPIEERDGDEIRKLGDKYITVPGVDVFNPAFDVTPARLIHAIITERRIYKAPYDFTRLKDAI